MNKLFLTAVTLILATSVTGILIAPQSETDCGNGATCRPYVNMLFAIRGEPHPDAMTVGHRMWNFKEGEQRIIYLKFEEPRGFDGKDELKSLQLLMLQEEFNKLLAAMKAYELANP